MPRTLPPDMYDISADSPRSKRTLFLGLLSAGIVVILLAGLIGTAAYLVRDQEPSSPRQGPRETPVAQANPRPTSKTVVQQSSNQTLPEPAVQLDKPTRRKGAATSDTTSSEPAPSKRQEEARPATRVEEEQTQPPRREIARPDAPAKEETPKTEPPAKEEVPKPAPAPKEEPPKREEPPKAETPKADPPEKEETPRGNSTPRTEASETAKTSSPLPERRRLSGEELYRRLVKSCVYVRNREGWGSGSLIHKERKLILTNYHVVGESAEVYISFPRYDNSGKLIVAGDVYERAYKSKELIRGKVLKIAKGQDLALVVLDTVPDGTPALKLAARSASPGQVVHSVGNPGASDARWAYTHGTVRQLSHKTWRALGAGRKILSFDADILETQSPTNPGDSGGPLVNDAIQLVGVTQGADVSANELSFFIEMSEVKKLLQSCDVDLNDVTASPDDADGGIVETADLLALIKCLEDKDAKNRTQAAHRLAELGQQAKRAAPALVNALKNDEESLVRQAAAFALGKLGPVARDLVRKEVFTALRDADEDVRLAVLEALANLGAPDLTELPIMLSRLRNSVERQQFKPCLLIARSLALLGPRAKDAVPDLREMFKAEDRSVRAAALLTLRKIGSAAREAAPELGEALKDTDREMRMQAALALTAIDPSLTGAGKNALSVLVQALRPASVVEGNEAQAKERVKEISAVLVKIGEPAVERLLRAIGGEFRRGRNRGEDAVRDAQARAAALKIIADIGPAACSTETIKVLVELQRSEPPGPVREAARQAYIAIQDSK